jgi:hypothetical protein
MRRRIKIEEHTFLLKIYKVIANKIGDDETKELCEKR